MKDYNEYSITVGTEPSAYGSECTNEDAQRIAESVAELIRREFPGMQVYIAETGKPVTGPDSETVDEINQWIDENLTTAL